MGVHQVEREVQAEATAIGQSTGVRNLSLSWEQVVQRQRVYVCAGVGGWGGREWLQERLGRGNALPLLPSLRLHIANRTQLICQPDISSPGL